MVTDIGLGLFVEMSFDEDAPDCHAEVVVDVTYARSPARFVLIHAEQRLQPRPVPSVRPSVRLSPGFSDLRL